jgi:PAS domain S-box-containing protein
VCLVLGHDLERMMDRCSDSNQTTAGFNSESSKKIQHLKQRLYTSEARAHCLLATLPQIVWVATAQGKVTNLSKRWYEYTGLTATQSVGWRFLQAFHPEDRDRVVRYWEEISYPPQHYQIQCRIQDADGNYCWFEGQGTPICSPDGEVLEWIGTYSLIESSTQVAETYEQKPPAARLDSPESDTLQRSQELTEPSQLSLLEQELPQAIIWEAEATNRQFTFVSHNAERILGYPIERWLEEPDFLAKVIHPDDRQWVLEQWRQEAQNNRDGEIKYRCLSADNRVVWFRDRDFVVEDQQRHLRKRRGLMIDITATQQESGQPDSYGYTAALTQLGKQAIDNTNVSVLMHSSVRLVSEMIGVECCHIFEWQPEEKRLQQSASVGEQQPTPALESLAVDAQSLMGCTMRSPQPVIMDDVHPATHFHDASSLKNQGWVSGVSVVIGTALGQEPPPQSPTDEGKASCFGVLAAYSHKHRCFISRDVEFLQAVANLLALAIRSQRAFDALGNRDYQLSYMRTSLANRNSELDHFTYVASHDLKAPLRAIANLSQWIEEDISEQLEAENLYQMQLMRGRVYRLDALIDGLLQYSRAGRSKTPPEQVAVEKLLEQVILALDPPTEFTIKLDSMLPTLVTERLLLQQVFTHLLSNAIRHHPRQDGTVVVRAQDLGDCYEFAVADDGAGIAPCFHQKIFVIFQTLQARDTTENTGVGLAIAKKIVEGKGGTIRLESQEGQGATFYFTWPKLC